MPFADPKRRREYAREYEPERALGLRRGVSVVEVLATMDQRRESRREYLKAWAAENRERRNLQQRERRRAARREAEAAALKNL